MKKVLLLAFCLAGCGGAVNPGLTEDASARYIPRDYYMPNYQENHLINQFPSAVGMPDKRYQYALLQQPEVQYKLHKVVRNGLVNGNQERIGDVGQVALHATASSDLYYFQKTRSLCREMNLTWEDLNTRRVLDEGNQILCQIGPNQEWLPLS